MGKEPQNANYISRASTHGIKSKMSYLKSPALICKREEGPYLLTPLATPHSPPPTLCILIVTP